ncbi:cytochrome P450 [Mycolicibacterium baixiangningiae]|uniref:cytochrome P450 n=1 Tax=Mycolicibacterium baixiangningiae TaxID=2761578 RepID=UPI001865FB15|nr:cytochrome P450 [Mycolicibacterium baixiangningiae]
MATETSDPVRLPPGPSAPKLLQGVALLSALVHVIAALGRRYGSTYTVNLPIYGQTVVISDPVLVKDVFSTSGELLERPTNLGGVFGPGSTFSLNGAEHLERRKVLVPAFHGKRVKSYEAIIEEETMRETADWPEGTEFETLQPMMRLTLNTILRAVFGAEGSALDELRVVIPPAVTFGSRLIPLPSVVRRDFGRWSPGGRFLEYRRRIDAVIDSLIAEARADPECDQRSDVLALLLQARYDNGEPISDRHIADELLTLVSAGHETTAAALAWAVERIRRNPHLLSRLTDEVDAGGSDLRQATIWEVLRTRPVLNATMRRTRKRISLGEWVIPEGATLVISIQLAHNLEQNFADASTFNPDRFLDAAPKPSSWIPFGGGVNRCIGAALANLEMDVSLRTILREFRFSPTDEPDEPRHYRGLAIAPGRGGRAIVHRRTSGMAGADHSASVAGNIRAEG